jgi:hypothetical protein
MLHNLIDSAENWRYQPFAKNCINKLKRLGMAYADQSYEIDGVSIKVRIEPGHEYIRIEGGGVDLKMDSGVIDLGVFNPIDPAKYLPGRNYKSELVTAYDSAFTTKSTKKDGVYVAAGSNPGDMPTLTYTTPYFTKPADVSPEGKKTITSVGQASGEIKVGTTVAGFVRFDGVTKAFEPKRIMNSATPPARAPDPADSTLVAKKTTAGLCPPSMFTGRARLYAQAMLGQHLYQKDEVSNEPPTVVLSLGRPPALRPSQRKDKNSDRAKAFADNNSARIKALQKAGILYPVDEFDVVINVSSGVYLDPETGKHWLLNIGTGEMKVYELVGTPGAESMRKWLTPKYASKLNDADRTHLETYILAYSRPLIETRQVVPLGVSVSPYSMGYGWHWNWSGTTACIVINAGYSQGGSNVGMESTRYQLVVTRTTTDGLTSFAASASIAEGPTRWSVYRRSWCITHPDWVNRNMSPDALPTYWSEKTTFRDSEFTVASGFFYAFYKKDELQVCRVVTALAGGTPAYDTTSSPDYWQPLGGYQRGTHGMMDGFYEHTNAVAEYKTCAFSVGSVSVGTARYGHFESGYEESISDKFDLGYGAWGFSNSYLDANQLTYGHPDDQGVWACAVLAGFASYMNQHNTRMTYTQNGFNKEWYESIAVAVPHYDAEAVYSRFYSRLDDRKISRSNQYWAQSGFAVSSCVTQTPPYSINSDQTLTYLDRYPSSAIYTKFTSSYPGWWTTTWKDPDTTPDETETTEVVVEKLHHRSGVADATMGGLGWELGDIFSTDPDLNEYIMAEYPARSSADFAKPVVLGLVGPIGTTKTDGNLALVGWA